MGFEERPSAGLAGVLSVVPHGVEGAGEEDERVVDRRDAQVVDPPDDDPVIAGGMLGDDLALEGGEGVGEQRYAAAPGLPVEAGEAVGAGGGRASRSARAAAPAR